MRQNQQTMLGRNSNDEELRIGSEREENVYIHLWQIIAEICFITFRKLKLQLKKLP